jgi:putative nucleotidyltransferase with HDIG domain
MAAMPSNSHLIPGETLASPMADEAARLALLRRYGLLETPPEPEYDDLAMLAAQVCRAPMALLGLIDHDRLWVKAHCNLPIAAIPREHTLFAVLGGPHDLVVVDDLAGDARTASHPMVALGPRVRFYAAMPLIVEGHLLGVLEVLDRVPRSLAPEQAAGLRAVARQALGRLELSRVKAERAARRNRASTRELNVAYDATLASLAAALDLRDRETEGHLQRVADITVRLARVLGVPEDDLPHIRRGALLHDIGKMAIPDQILLKPSALNDEEWAIMHRHPVFAFEMLSPVTLLRPALDIPYCHHERWDGQGYPRGLKGEEIPLAARIFAVVDVWDALRSDRPYRAGWADDRVRDYIARRAGADFDPRVVEAFLALPR